MNDQEKRVEAAADYLHDRGGSRLLAKETARGALDAADRAVPIMTTVEFKEIVEAIQRESDENFATAQDFAGVLQAIVASGCIEEVVVARDVLDRHPEFIKRRRVNKTERELIPDLVVELRRKNAEDIRRAERAEALIDVQRAQVNSLELELEQVRATAQDFANILNDVANRRTIVFKGSGRDQIGVLSDGMFAREVLDRHPEFVERKEDHVSRESRVREIQRTRLGGADQIILDDPGTPPYKRYAHVMAGSLGTNLYTTDDPFVVDDAYKENWKLVGVIDLDSGDVVDPPVRQTLA